MTKADMIKLVKGELEAYQRAGRTLQEAADNIVEGLFRAYRESLKNGEAVTVNGFGALRVVERAARTGRNPRTGQPVEVPACNAVKFTASKALKEALA